MIDPEKKYMDMAFDILDDADLYELQKAIAKKIQSTTTELEQQLADEKERRSMEAEYAHDAGLESARKGIQEVNIDEDSDPESKGFIEGDVPFCRIHWFEDSGDWSVGIQGYAAWVLDENQEGTGLERMQSKLIEQDKQIQGLIEALENVIYFSRRWSPKNMGQGMEDLARKALTSYKEGK